MIKILFICHGNICRSPMAEFILKDMVKNPDKYFVDDETVHKIKDLDFYIESAAVSREEIGNDIYPPAKEILALNDIPFEKREARQITASDYEKFDCIFLMDQSNKHGMEKIIPTDPQNKIKMFLNKDIEDPWYTGNFQKVYDEIVKGCKNFIKKCVEKF